MCTEFIIIGLQFSFFKLIFILYECSVFSTRYEGLWSVRIKLTTAAD